MSDFDFEVAEDKRRAARAKHARRRALTIAATLIGVVALAAGALYLISKFGSDRGGTAQVATQTYQTTQDIDLRESADPGAGVVSRVKARSIVSGHVAQTVGGAAWLEVSTIDGVTGFAPASFFESVNDNIAPREVDSGLRRIETTNMVNLRAAPSLSAAVVGTADGGTKLVADAVFEAEHNRWFRVPLTPSITAFIVARYTQPSDDGGPDGDLGVAQSASSGAPARVKSLTNLLSSPLDDGRIIRALSEGESVNVIGQTRADIWYYVVIAADGTQGFVSRESLSISGGANRYIYADGTVAPGPNIRRADFNARQAARASQSTSSAGATTDSDNGAATAASADSGVAAATSPAAPAALVPSAGVRPADTGVAPPQ